MILNNNIPYIITWEKQLLQQRNIFFKKNQFGLYTELMQSAARK